MQRQVRRRRLGGMQCGHGHRRCVDRSRSGAPLRDRAGERSGPADDRPVTRNMVPVCPPGPCDVVVLCGRRYIDTAGLGRRAGGGTIGGRRVRSGGWSRGVENSLDVSRSGGSTASLLAGNPLGDPAKRPVLVYLPPGYDESTERYPSIYLIQGLSGQVDMWRNRSAFRPNAIELIDALFAGESDGGRHRRASS